MTPDAVEKRLTAGSGLVDRLRREPKLYLYGPAALMATYLVVMRVGTGAIRPVQLGVTALVLALCYWSDATRALFKGLFPFLVFAIVYDAMHITEPLVRFLHVHIATPYHFDKALFGIHTAQGVLTPNEFFALHHWPAVDLLTGTSYIVYVYWAFGLAIYLALFRKEPAMKQLLVRYGWVFCAVNLAAFATYYIYPAAPPWYAAHYGFGTPDFAHIAASPAAAIRWDQLTGLHYFQGFYGQSADIFGAIPSLHVAYPLMVFIYGRYVRNLAFNIANFLFYLLVCFSAVYLQHHYILDVMLGTTYALVAFGIERAVTHAIERRRRQRRDTPGTPPAIDQAVGAR